MRPTIIFTLLVTFLVSCQSGIEQVDITKLRQITAPIAEISQTPNLVVSHKDEVYLSWTKGDYETGYALQYAKWEGAAWGEAETIVSGKDWFVNWADFPSLAVRSDGSLAAHWLPKRAKGTYDYDVKIIQKRKEPAANWENPFVIHQDSVSAEHGFVSMLPLANGRMLVVWLDGRNTRVEGSTGMHGHGGPMSLRSAEFDIDGKRYHELEIDNRVCDCCQTDLTMGAEGPILIYRDRSDKEVRDISYVRYQDGKWNTPATLGQDNWIIEGCPVNGPALTSQGKQVAVAWFSGAEKLAKIQVAFSKDAGATFGKAIDIQAKNPLGRVDIEFIATDRILLSWIELGAKSSQVMTVVVDTSAKVYTPVTIGEIDGSRLSGFPIMAKRNKQLFFTWTKAPKPLSIQTYVLDLE